MAFKDHEVEVCEDAFEFLMALTCFEPDLAIVDYHMDQMNGSDAIRKSGRKDLPVILVSADSPENLARQAQQLRSEGYNIKAHHVKPIGVKDLKGMLK